MLISNTGKLALEILGSPESATVLSPSSWDSLLCIFRSEGLLASLHARLEQQGLLASLPDTVQDHLLAARVIANDHERMIRWEVNRIQYALRDTNIAITLLKGAAYAMAGLPPARGRLVSDVDILVPHSTLPAVEAALLQAGWLPIQENEYDQRYFREWMHEIPPLRHELRQTDVDVHHAILPRTARLRPDSTKLLAAMQKIDNNLHTLSDVDMVLHSATHLFFGGDLDHGLRDLLDLHDLLTHFSEQSDFWQRLVPRACELDLQRPLFYTLRYSRRYLHTAIPGSVIRQSQIGSPNIFITAVMDRLVNAVMLPRIPGLPPATVAFRRWLLYVRSHYVRMPLNLLIPHLTRKALRRAEAQVIGICRWES